MARFAKPQSLAFEVTPALLAFRQVSGDANRFLNTQLVALETLKTAAPVRPDDLTLSWTLPSAETEWIETRHFTMRSTMVAVVDSVDRYMRMISQLEGLVASELHNDLNGRRRPDLERRLTLSERVQTLCRHYPEVTLPQYVAAVELLAAWRNRFVHRSSKEGLSRGGRTALVSAAHFFKKEHAGSDIIAAIARFDVGEAPTLPNLSTLIASTHRLITALDEHLLFLQDASTYAVSLMKYLIRDQPKPSQYLESIFQHGGKRSAGRVHSIFLHNGANHDPKHRDTAPVLTRKQLAALFAIGRKHASTLLDIPRPTSLA